MLDEDQLPEGQFSSYEWDHFEIKNKMLCIFARNILQFILTHEMEINNSMDFSELLADFICV